MKRCFILLANLLVFAGVAFAQDVQTVLTYSGDAFYPNPVLSFGSEDVCYYLVDSEEMSVRIFDADFNEVKNFNLPKITYISIKQSEVRAVSGFTPLHIQTDDATGMLYDNPMDITTDEIQNRIETYYYSGNVKLKQVTSSADSNVYYYISESDHVQEFYWDYDLHGAKYPREYFYTSEEDGVKRTYKAYVYNYISEYMGEWEIHSSADTTTYDVDYFDESNFYIIDGISERMEHFVTSDLFDDDDSTFEVLVPNYGAMSDFNVVNSFDRDDNGEVDERVLIRQQEKMGYDIYSDGVKVASLDFGNGFTYCERVFVNKGNIFFAVRSFDDDITTILKYNKKTSDIKAVASYKSKASIRMRDNIVEIELSEPRGCDCEIMITSAVGQLCHRQNISAGEKSVRIDARRLNKGVYNFTVIDAGKVVENGKLLIK